MWRAIMNRKLLSVLLLTLVLLLSACGSSPTPENDDVVTEEPVEEVVEEEVVDLYGDDFGMELPLIKTQAVSDDFSIQFNLFKNMTELDYEPTSESLKLVLYELQSEQPRTIYVIDRIIDENFNVSNMQAFLHNNKGTENLMDNETWWDYFQKPFYTLMDAAGLDKEVFEAYAITARENIIKSSEEFSSYYNDGTIKSNGQYPPIFFSIQGQIATIYDDLFDPYEGERTELTLAVEEPEELYDYQPYLNMGNLIDDAIPSYNSGPFGIQTIFKSYNGTSLFEGFTHQPNRDKDETRLDLVYTYQGNSEEAAVEQEVMVENIERYFTLIPEKEYPEGFKEAVITVFKEKVNTSDYCNISLYTEKSYSIVMECDLLMYGVKITTTSIVDSQGELVIDR